MSAEYEAEAYEPLATNADASGPAVQSASVTAINSAVYIGNSIQGGIPVQTPIEQQFGFQKGLKRDEWTLLEEEYGDEAWLRPLPWEKRIRFDPEDFYVPLNLHDQGRDGLRPRSKEAELENLFDSHVQGGDSLPKRVLLRGNAGFGKTTLCTKVAFDWKWNKSSIRSLPCKSTLIVFYKLKLFDSKNDLKEVLLKFLYENHSVVGKSYDLIRNTVKALGQDLVLFLDGYDEMDEKGKRKLEALILACKKRQCGTFSGARFLVTARPSDRQEFLDLFEKHYSIGNLSRDRKERLVLKYFENSSSNTEEFFRRHSDLELDEASPLTLFLLCWVSQHKTQDPLCKGRDLIFQCIVLLARRCDNRGNLELTDKELEKFFFQFGRLYYTHTCSYKQEITDESLKEFFNYPKMILLAKDMGILRQYQSDGGLCYDTVHKTFFDSLSNFFRDRVIAMRSECLDEREYEEFLVDFLSNMRFISRVIEVQVCFSATTEPVLTVKEKDNFEISSKNGRPEIGFPEVTQLDLRSPSLSIECCPQNLNFVEDVIIPLIIERVCPTQKDILFKYLVRMGPLSKYIIMFENIHDARFQKLVIKISELFIDHQESTPISFAARDEHKEKELLCSLTTALDTCEDATGIEDRSVEELFKGISSWADNHVYNTRFQRTIRSASDTFPLRDSFDLRFLGPRELDRKDWKLLEEQYEQNKWLQPFPWAPKFCLDDEDFYAPLSLDYSDGREHQSVRAELESLFDGPNQGRARRVLLRGEAGFGKTTLCKKLALDWSRRRTSVRALPCDSILIVLYELKNFASKSNLEEELIHFMFKKHEMLKERWKKTKGSFRYLGRDLVLILDGYDELNQSGKTQLISLIHGNKHGKGQHFPDASVLVTSKPTTEMEFLDLFDKRYSMETFPRDKTKQFVLKFFQNNLDESEAFWRRHLDLKLEEASPLALTLHCWISQQKEEDQLSQGCSIIFRCIVQCARECNDRLGLKLTDEEIVICLFRLGQLFYISRDCGLFPKKILREILDDPRLSKLAKNMGILKIVATEGGLLCYHAAHAEFSDSLIGFFCYVASELRLKCLPEEYETFVYDFIALFSIFESMKVQDVHFPACGEPVLTFVCLDKLKLTLTNLEIGLEFKEPPKFTGMVSASYDSLVKCFSKKKVLKDSKKSGRSSFYESQWVRIIIPWFVKTDCSEERKNFLFDLLREVRCFTLQVKFDNLQDNRFQEFLVNTLDVYTKAKMSFTITFEFPGGVTDEREFLTSLAKALGLVDDTQSLSTEKLRNKITSWAQNEPCETEFCGDWASGPLTSCTLKRTAIYPRQVLFEFIFRGES